MCRNLLSEPADKREHIQDTNRVTHRLIIQKDRGGLVYPTDFVIKVITNAEAVLRQTEVRNVTVERLQVEVLKLVGGPPDSFVQHALDTQDGISNHYFAILRKILSRYHHIRQYSAAKTKNNLLHPKKGRSKRNKETLFRGE